MTQYGQIAFTPSSDLAICLSLSDCARSSVARSAGIWRQNDLGHLEESVEMARVDSARGLLEDTDKPLQRVPSSCGFANPDVMRRIGAGPSEYRERFRR